MHAFGGSVGYYLVAVSGLTYQLWCSAVRWAAHVWAFRDAAECSEFVDSVGVTVATVGGGRWVSMLARTVPEVHVCGGSVDDVRYFWGLHTLLLLGGLSARMAGPLVHVLVVARVCLACTV